jgi:hypothetical protein
MSSARPLRSTGITPLLRYYGPLRLPLRSACRLCLPLGGLPLGGSPRPAQSRAKGSSTVLSAHAVPFHPGEPDDCIFSFLHHQYWLHPIRKTGHSHWCNEAEPGSLALRLTPLPLEASPRRITPSCARLATCVTRNSHGELLSVH